MHPLHARASYWIKQGIFDHLRSFETFEARINRIPSKKDREDIFEIFVEGYLESQTITQCKRHWVSADIPLSLRERYKVPRDATHVGGIYQTHDGGLVAYGVEYSEQPWLAYRDVAPFLGITEKFPDRIIFTNAVRLSQIARERTRWVGKEVFQALLPNAMGAIEGWLKTNLYASSGQNQIRIIKFRL